VDIVSNKKVGTHDGIAFYTYGQNKGLGLSSQSQKYFVCNKDIKQNILYVCNTASKNKYLTSTKCELVNFNWISKVPIIKKVQIRFRHRQSLINGRFNIKDGKVILIYTPTIAVTPGQFAVLYQKNICLGGGIVNVLNNPILQ
jgi:tRNA-specific 2-thiouridylase